MHIEIFYSVSATARSLAGSCQVLPERHDISPKGKECEVRGSSGVQVSLIVALSLNEQQRQRQHGRDSFGYDKPSVDLAA